MGNRSQNRLDGRQTLDIKLKPVQLLIVCLVILLRISLKPYNSYGGDLALITRKSLQSMRTHTLGFSGAKVYRSPLTEKRVW